MPQTAVPQRGLVLYNAPPSTCSQKVRLALAEKSLPWHDRRVDLRANEHLEDWYLALNPNAVVPTLLHDGRIILDSSVINEYLDEVFPQVPLVPADPYERARMRAWKQYIDEVPTPAIRVPSFNAFVLKNWSQLSDREFERAVETRTVRKHFYRKMEGRGGFGKADMDEALEQLREALERMEKALADGPWMVGEQLTIADLALVPTVVRLDDLKLERLWNGLPRVAGWYARIQKRPSFAKTYYAGSRPVIPEAIC
jgi:glutathione S-transferase